MKKALCLILIIAFTVPLIICAGDAAQRETDVSSLGNNPPWTEEQTGITDKAEPETTNENETKPNEDETTAPETTEPDITSESETTGDNDIETTIDPVEETEGPEMGEETTATLDDETAEETDSEPEETNVPSEEGEPNETTLTEDTTEQNPPNTTSILMSFVGDVMLASYKNETKPGSFNEYVQIKENTYFFEKVMHIFKSDDFTLVNLENVFTDKDLPEAYKSTSPAYWYRSQTSNANILTVSGIEAVSLANNHVKDYGLEGLADTIEAVKNVGLMYGTYDDIIYFEKDGFTIAVICDGMWAEYQVNSIIERIAEASDKSDFQIVYYHGGTEYLHAPEAWKARASRKMVDNGADLVIGNHPHVLQPREIYNGVEIIYSLGNFCFGGMKYPENRTIIYQLELIIDKETNTISAINSEMIPCYVNTSSGMNNYQPGIVEDEKIRKKILDFMNGLISTPV